MLPMIFLLCILEITLGVPLSGFYPFGQQAGDEKLHPNDDGSSPNISINSLFPFFNHQHRQLIVNTNGAISFLGVLSTFTPDPFPLESNRRIVAPFWADVDITNGGNVWYRETTNENLLRQASDEVREYFTSQPRFHAAWMFIATWDNVAFFGCEDLGCNKRNTFQVILVTNGQHSFTIFNFDNIEWTTGRASEGNANTGLGGTPAQVGFDAGDGVNFYAVNASRTPDIININRYSNVNITGKFAFRIDTETVEDGGCNTRGFLTIVPQHDLSMLGGQKLTFGGPCLPEYATIKASFNGQDDRLCKRINRYRFTCITPMFYTTDDVTVEITIRKVNGPLATNIGILTPANLARTIPKVIRETPVYWKRGLQRTIEWDANNLLPYQNVDIDLFVLTDANGTLRWNKSKTVTSGVPVSDETATFILDLDEAVGAVRLSPQNDMEYNEAIWSDVFFVFPSKQIADESCSQWLSHDATLPNIDGVDMQACPCTLQQALIDLGRFQRDPVCNMFSKNSNTINTNCLYNVGAQHCVRLATRRVDGFSISCCYDTSGNFIDARSKHGGGTKQRYNYLGNNENSQPFLSNLYYDVRPFLHCCTFHGRTEEHQSQNTGIRNSGQCERFFERRPPSNCQGYIPPAPAAGHGDPHIQTLDGFSYTFNGVGEYTLLKDVNGTFEIDVRMEQVTDDHDRKRMASVFTSLVAYSKNRSDVIEVTLNSIRIADVLINKDVVDFTDTHTQWRDFRGLSVIVTNGNESGIVTKDILITFDDPKVGIKCIASQHVLNIITVVGEENLKGNVEGLLGNFDGDNTTDLKKRSGEVIPYDSTSREIHEEFGETWRIQESDSFFKYPIGKSYSSFQDPGFTPQFVTPTNVSDEIREICGDDAACIFDYHTTGMKEIAITTSSMKIIIQEFDEAAVQISSCGVPPSIANGIWNTTGLIEGSVAQAFCNDGFSLDAFLIYQCGENGLWIANGAVLKKMSCLKVSSCGVPPSIANGIWNTTGLIEGSVAEAICNDGFSLDTVPIYQCGENGLWMSNGEVLEKVSCLKESRETINNQKSKTWHLIAGVTVSTLVICIVAIVIIRFLYKKMSNSSATVIEMDKI